MGKPSSFVYGGSVAGPVVAYRGALVFSGSTPNASDTFWPAFWPRSNRRMTQHVQPVRTRAVDATAFGRLLGSCWHDREKRPLLLTAVSRYGNHWHVVMDSFMYAWTLLVERGLLDPSSSDEDAQQRSMSPPESEPGWLGERKPDQDSRRHPALPPIIVLQNGHETGPAGRRNSCCIKNRTTAPHEASVGPWTSLWKLLSAPDEPLRTEAWLHRTPETPRCFVSRHRGKRCVVDPLDAGLSTSLSLTRRLLLRNALPLAALER